MILTQFKKDRAWNKKLNKLKVDTFYFFIHILITIVKSNKELINDSITQIRIHCEIGYLLFLNKLIIFFIE